MEKKTESFPGTRKTNLKRSFKLHVHSLLTSCSKEQFSAAFSGFSTSEQTQLHRLFIQVITSLHENIEDEFESFCLEMQKEYIGDNTATARGDLNQYVSLGVDDSLDAVEHLIEKSNMDPLFSNQSNLGQIGEDLLVKKKNEFQYLKNLLEKAEEQRNIIKARVEQLKEQQIGYPTRHES